MPPHQRSGTAKVDTVSVKNFAHECPSHWCAERAIRSRVIAWVRPTLHSLGNPDRRSLLPLGVPRARNVAGLSTRLAIAILAVAACDRAPTSPEASEPWPRTEACEGLDEWPDAWTEHEHAVLEHLDELRSEGIDCGERGKLGSAPPLRRRTALDCAARSHAQDMVDQDYLGRFDPEGASERERVEAAGYSPSVLVQHIAAGPRDAAELLDLTWLPRPVPCSDLATPALTEIGIGYVGEVDGEPDEEWPTHWVVVLAGPDDASE